MPDDRPYRRPTLPGMAPTSEVDAVWRALDRTEVAAEKRFGSIEGSIKEMSATVTDIQGDVKGILETDERRTASAEKRNARLWQVSSAVMVALLVAVIVAVFKVVAPLALSGDQARPPTVNETLDKIHQVTGGH